MQDTLSGNQTALRSTIRADEDGILLEQQAQFIKKQQQQIHFLQEALRFELDRIQWDQGETPDTFCQRFEFLGAPLQNIISEDERVHMFKIRCPNFLRRFLVESEAKTWADVKKACELKTDMNLQKFDHVSSSTQSRIQHAQKLLQPRQRQVIRARSHDWSLLRPQPGQNRIAKQHQGTGGVRREGQQSHRDLARPNESTKHDKIICNNCKVGDHKAVDCPEPQVCYRCNQEGHRKRECPFIKTLSTVSSSANIPMSRQKVAMVID
ncbi:hypothetical protein EMPS_02762 [Entomortierella parvispora]|uniref:CCHC-type domain-containing protein n=1 Tax=Entomortierella parvispora TaxID=205924 RepID=A0A9P3H5G8_9FUNG|nr:hypothetical protein EMPS_02762 [Entomortierella parvispora]